MVQIAFRHYETCLKIRAEVGTGIVIRPIERIFVLDSGEIIEVGPPAQIRNSDAVRHAYMGTQAETKGVVL